MISTRNGTPLNGAPFAPPAGPPALGREQVNGQDFYEQVNEQLGHVIVGEREARLGYATAMISGLNVVYFGPPGAGKTNLLHYGHSMIDGLGENGVKFIPPQSDLTGKEMSGGMVSTYKTITEEGSSRTEQSDTTIEPILHPEVRVLIADEVNRANPLAIGAALEALESHRVVNNQGERDLLSLQYAAFAFNPRGIDRTVYPMSPALISRLPIGVHMGSNPNDESAILDAAFRKKLTSPQLISPVTNIGQLKQLRAQADALHIPEELHGRAATLLRQTRLALRDCKITEGIGRQAHQVVRIASALAILGGHEVITMGDIAQATKFGIVSRIGASEVSEDAHAVYEGVLDKSDISDRERNVWYVSQTHAIK